MNYTQIRAFHAVASHGGFSRAAAALNQTQPSLSEQVRRLEQAHDTLLFLRQARSVQLTKAGEALFVLTKRFFEAEAAISTQLTESRAALTGRLRIVADSARHITPILTRFRRRHPGVFVSVTTANTDDVLAILRRYDAEVGVVGSQSPASDLNLIDLGASPIVGIAAVGSPHAGQTLRLDALGRLPLIMREGGSRTRRLLEDAAQREGIALVPVAEVDGREAMREVVASGAGVGFISKAELGQDDRLSEIELEGGALLMPEAVVSLKQRSDVPVIRAFLAAVRESIDSTA